MDALCRSRIPAPRGAGFWQYISLPRGADPAAGTLRTGYCEDGPKARPDGQTPFTFPSQGQRFDESPVPGDEEDDDGSDRRTSPAGSGSAPS